MNEQLWPENFILMSNKHLILDKIIGRFSSIIMQPLFSIIVFRFLIVPYKITTHIDMYFVPFFLCISF